MKTRISVIAASLGLASFAAALHAEKQPEPPVPVTVIKTAPATQPEAKPENQSLYGPSNATVIPVEQAQALVSRFKEAYVKLGSPRIVFCINRELVDNQSAAKERTELSLADKQTIREIERLFGRVFRASGASIADAKTAASLQEDKPVSNLPGTNDQAAKDREALAKVADVAIEILISTRVITDATVSGDQVLSIPDVQVTAIRLRDAAILGQASSSDILGKDRNAAQMTRHFDVREITEATALALMEDMMAHQK